MASTGAFQQSNAQESHNIYLAGQNNAPYFNGNGSHQIIFDPERNTMYLSAGEGENTAYGILPKPTPVVIERPVPYEVDRPVSKPPLRSKRCCLIIFLVIVLIVIIAGIAAGVAIHEANKNGYIVSKA